MLVIFYLRTWCYCKAPPVAMKLLVDDKIAACAKQKCLLGVIIYINFRAEKRFLVKHFAFLKNVTLLCFE